MNNTQNIEIISIYENINKDTIKVIYAYQGKLSDIELKFKIGSSAYRTDSYTKVGTSCINWNVVKTEYANITYAVKEEYYNTLEKVISESVFV